MQANPSRKRVRSKGRWSGADAKHLFLLACLCDEELANRLEALRGTSAWWPWLSAQPGAEGDRLTYLCPTYVLYDALSDAGRGEWGVVNCMPCGCIVLTSQQLYVSSPYWHRSLLVVSECIFATLSMHLHAAPVAVHARWVIHSPGIPLNADDLESAYQKTTALKVSE